MSKPVYQYRVISEIRGPVPKKLESVFSVLRVGDVISAKSLIANNQDKIPKDQSKSTFMRLISTGIKTAHDKGFLQRIDDKFVPEWFCNLDTISYWQSQLRGSRLKNGNGKSANGTRGHYLHHLWKFQKWLVSRDFEISVLEPDKKNRFTRKTERRRFENVEELLHILDQPFAEPKNIVRIVKQYLVDESHTDKKASYMNIIKYAIVSYFEKNEQPIRITFNPKTTHSTEKEMEQNMSISDVMEFLTAGKPSLMEKALFLCKFHRGLDASTLADRFNYEAWPQMVKWFGSEHHNYWDLDKCPVPITLTRIKTDYKHVGFLDRDAVEQVQRYLDYRKEKTGHAMEKTQPMFLNKFKRPITTTWIFHSFSRIANRAGIQEFVEWNGRKQYKMDSHEMRDLLKSTLIDSGCRIDVADHVIGHKPKDSYEKQAVLYPETMRKEYAKASGRLNLFTKFSNVVSGKDDADELRVELNQKLRELDRTLKQEKSEYVARERNSMLAESQKKTLDKILENSESQAKTIESLKAEVERLKSPEKKLEFCCIDCEMIHGENQCPACGSRMRRIYEGRISG